MGKNPSEMTDAERVLEDQARRWAPKRTTVQKRLEGFATLGPDDPRWSHMEAVTCGDCYVFVETESYRIFPFSVKLQAVIPIRQEWWKVHVMHSVRLAPTTFKVYLHQGVWRYAASAWVGQAARGVKFDFGVPPPKGYPFLAQRREMVRYLAAALGVGSDAASKLFFDWTGQ